MARESSAVTDPSVHQWSLKRRQLLGLLPLGVLPAVLGSPARAWAFGEEGAFHPRLLSTGVSGAETDEARRALGYWSYELVRRTSAPARLSVETVHPASAEVLDEPLLVWPEQSKTEELAPAAIRRLREFLHLGGTLIVDQRSAAGGTFLPFVKKQLARVLPEAAPVQLPAAHVVFKSFYLLDGPSGRAPGSGKVEGLVLGQTAQVILLDCDLLGALARTQDGEAYAHPVQPGGARQRELATRFAVNLAMYVLCSDYKDDQVHAPFLMRRRQAPPRGPEQHP